MSAPYDLEINRNFKAIAKANNITLHEGVYASVIGPQLETRAEYRMLKIIGADAVGMSTVPEIIVANHLNLKVAAVSVLTDECDPENLKPVDISEIIAMAGKAEPDMITLFKALIKVKIAGIITAIPTIVAIVEYLFLLATFAYLYIGKPNSFITKNVANAIKIVLIINKYIAPIK